MKMDIVRWAIGVGVAALVAYFTTTGAINRELGEVKATEAAHHLSTNQKIDVAVGDIKGDLREIRNAVYRVAVTADSIKRDVR